MTDILFVISSLDAGGAERVAVNLSTHWVDVGYETALVTMASEKHDYYTLHKDVKRTALGLTGQSDNFISSLLENIKRVFVLRRVFKQYRPKVVVSFMTTNNVLTIFAALGLGCRVIVSERSHPPLTTASSFWNTLRSRTYGMADLVVVLAKEGREWILRNTRASEVVIIPNWVVWPMVSFEPKIAPDDLLTDDCKIILTVGGPCDVKGHDLLLEAFSSVSNEYPDWKLAIVGADDPALPELIEKFGLEDRTVCTSRIGNVSDWYKKAEIYVLSSRTEGFPNALLEAMASGCAPIAFDCDTGPRDILVNNENGLLVNATDVEGLGEGLRELMSDEAKRTQFGQQASLVQSTFSVKSIQGQWDKALELCVD